jgi:hypothetical protein
MSGGITQLVAIGAQDAHIVGDPEVSFFRSTYKRHTNFSQTTERQVIQGNVSNGGMSTIRIERKGDLLSQMYFTVDNGTETRSETWTDLIEKVELLIGGQVIDTQDREFITNIAVDTLATNMSKSGNGLFRGKGTLCRFFPLRFFFCENFQSSLPLVALQYHDVELRITWGPDAAPSYTDPTDSRRWECFANYIYLDTQERQDVAGNPRQMLITQVQKALPSNSKSQELNFNHPVKFLASSNINSGGLFSTTNKVKLQINGSDIVDYKFAVPNYTSVPAYYNTPFTAENDTSVFIYPFCLDTAKLQPTGTLNFSRVDSARILSQSANITDAIYAVNYNILRIENGMAGIVYAN